LGELVWGIWAYENVGLRITQSLQEQLEQTTEQEQETIGLAIMDNVYKMDEVMKSDKYQTPESKAEFIHGLVDKMIESDLNKWKAHQDYIPISCKKGCNWCCQQMVFITQAEASLLVSKLQDRIKTQPQIIDKLKEQSKYNEGQIDEFWLLPKEKSACVFLTSNGLCSVYKDRPNSCRNLMVTSEPSFCSKESQNNVEKFVSVNGEIMASAVLSLPNQVYEPMPILLLKEMKNRGLFEE